MQTVKNVQKVFDLTPAQWYNLFNKKVHLVICGNHATNDAIFTGLIDRAAGIYYLPPDEEGDNVHPFTLSRLKNMAGIRIELHGIVHNLYWGDIIELWPLEKECDYCKGAGKFNEGAGKPTFPALAWLGVWEEVCSSCGGSGKIPILTPVGSAD